MPALIDVNVLVALLHAAHIHSEAATRWLDEQTDAGSVVLCRVVQMGALRILTRPSIMGADLLSPSQFWTAWEQVLDDERFRFEPEPAGLEAVWRRLTETLPERTCAETDAYLAAFAIAGGWSLCTFDRGFVRFPRLVTVYPA